MEVPVPFPHFAVRVGLAELSGEVVVGTAHLLLHRHAVQGAGLGYGIGGAAGPDFFHVAERGIDETADRATGVGGADLRADVAGQSAEFVVETVAVSYAAVGGNPRLLKNRRHGCC